MKGLLHEWLRRRLQTPYRSLRFKLMTFFLLVAIIPLLSLGVLSYRSSSSLTHNQFGKYGQYAVTQVQNQVDAQLNQMKITAESIYSYLLDPTKSVITEEVPRTYRQIQEKNDFEDFLKALKSDDYTRIYVITQSGYYYGDNDLYMSMLEQESWWKDFSSSHTDEYWIGMHPAIYYKEGSKNAGEDVIGLILPIRNQQGPLENARILIEMKADKIYNLFHLLERDTNAHVALRGNSNQSIYKTNDHFIPHADDVIWTSLLKTNDWTIEARLSYQQFYRSTAVIRSYTVIGLAGAMLLAMLLAYWLSSRLTGRIKHLKNLMLKAGTGQLEARFTIDSDDELGVLGRSFNNMLEQIQSLFDEVARTEKLKKEAELRAMHYQINPHLLFNTLNSIQWKARLQGNEEIRQMLYHLTVVLEGNLDLSQELVTVEQELKRIDHFLSIQRIRFGEVFDYERDIDERAIHCLIPRMSLQPLFENIFFHGFEDGAGRIVLRLKAENDYLQMILEDDGRGIDEARLRTLLQAETPKTTRGGLGLYNVDQKFKLHFGPGFGLRIESTKGKGTTITFVWPRREETEDGRAN
ncbi:sensor histidine kinase [Paenibacillus physcomitrellae]|uniref:Sensor histidine kinase YesM n=1 Tax=Paenibacillus physcomitrellae TaxID=1619311 RepID=A0ABQ1GE62_9BACL|nr:sensor histidine kinase [Paenibacillus physcomitrellae]GGA42116.1 sensor histidine kinase YesM [Paenibacillus physcomitrellae]